MVCLCAETPKLSRLRATLQTHQKHHLINDFGSGKIKNKNWKDGGREVRKGEGRGEEGREGRGREGTVSHE